MTNYQKMMSMNIEQCAEWIYNHTYACAQCPMCIECRKGTANGQLNPSPTGSECCDRIVGWLNKEAVDE